MCGRWWLGAGGCLRRTVGGRWRHARLRRPLPEPGFLSVGGTHQTPETSAASQRRAVGAPDRRGGPWAGVRTARPGARCRRAAASGCGFVCYHLPRLARLGHTGGGLRTRRCCVLPRQIDAVDPPTWNCRPGFHSKSVWIGAEVESVLELHFRQAIIGSGVEKGHRFPHRGVSELPGEAATALFSAMSFQPTFPE